MEEEWLDELLLQLEGKEAKTFVSKEIPEVPTLSSSSNNQISKTRRRQRKSSKHYRKPPYKTSFIPEIRILKRDIRRKYADMFNNVINSHDNKLFSSFIDDFYRPECVIIHTFPDNVPICFTPIEIQGTAMLKRLQAVNSLILPDSIARMTDTQICKRLYENGSRIFANYYIEATAIFLPKMFNGKAVDKNDVVVEYDLDPKDFYSFEKIEDYLQQLQLAAIPMNIKLSGTYEMLLDENHRILSLTISCVDVQFSQVGVSR